MTTNRMQEILVKLLDGDVVAKDKEEESFIKQSIIDIEQIKKMGYEISIPGEWPELD